MEHRLLTYFLMVCEELHFTRAAERLLISQPTLSHQIQLLEHQLGMPLFTRIGKKIYLSEAGCILRSHALNAFHELDQARAAIEELRGMKRGRLRIGCAGNHLLLSAIAAFYQQYPEIELSVQELATEEVKEGLLTNRVDLGIVYLPLDHKQLESIELFEDELQLAVAAGHPLAAADAVSSQSFERILLPCFSPSFSYASFLTGIARMQASMSSRSWSSPLWNRYYRSRWQGLVQLYCHDLTSKQLTSLLSAKSASKILLPYGKLVWFIAKPPISVLQ